MTVLSSLGIVAGALLLVPKGGGGAVGRGTKVGAVITRITTPIMYSTAAKPAGDTIGKTTQCRCSGCLPQPIPAS